MASETGSPATRQHRKRVSLSARTTLPTSVRAQKIESTGRERCGSFNEEVSRVNCLAFDLVEELLVLGRALERHRRGIPALDSLRHRIEIARAHFALMLDR